MLKFETNLKLKIIKSFRLSLASFILHEFILTETACSNSKPVWITGAWNLDIVCCLLLGA